MENNLFWLLLWPSLLVSFGLFFVLLSVAMKLSNNSKQEPFEITLGDKDEEGFYDTFRDGEKTNVKLLVFDEDQVEKINEAINRSEQL